MLLNSILLILGGAMLYFGAEWLVRGAAGMALKLGVRPLLIGLTVVSYATSAPELAVSVTAALHHESALALGNVVGSNIANIGLILGLTALISPPMSDGSLAKRELIVLLLASLALPLALLDHVFSPLEGVLFLVGSVAFTWLTIIWSRSRTIQLDEVPAEEKLSKAALIGIGCIGLVVLTLGGKAFVYSASNIAIELGVSDRVIGLTIVAFGTSLPELAASVVAALRGHGELAIGNVIGSNIFNILLILGVTSLVQPIEASLTELTLDLLFMGGLTLFAVLALGPRRTLSRVEGALLTLCYGGFLTILALESFV
ncbi:MAG: calcium/sodium antiporter [Polyangiaceae bacterium]|nr:calcium/sodium antiporter [Polyangiaceae bacterium]